VITTSPAVAAVVDSDVIAEGSVVWTNSLFKQHKTWPCRCARDARNDPVGEIVPARLESS
jgi:hypothetical protein